MDVYFVRHGHPNYKDDCLTGLGHMQAEAAAGRLQELKIQAVYSSTCGRAYETAEHTAKKLGLDVQKCEFMREISCRPLHEHARFQRGTIWNWLPEMIANDESITNVNWQQNPVYADTRIVESYQTVTDGIDRWLAELGYTREGAYYRVGEDTDRTVAMFSHGGSSGAVFSHLFGIPFPLFCASIHLDFTSVTLVRLSNETGKLVLPKLIYMGDAKHMEGLEQKDSSYGV